MAQDVNPEEQRFDFGVAVPEGVPYAGSADATTLQQRVRELAATARPARRAGGARGARATAAPADVTPADTTVGRGGRLSASELSSARETSAPDQAGVEDGVGTPDPDADDPGDLESAIVEESLTVAAFYERVKRALVHAFPEDVWVTGEIRGLRESRGHRYLELADEGAEIGGRAAAQQLEVVCWSREWPAVAVALADARASLEVGRVVRVRGRVSVWEGGSKLRFTLTALDVEALLGGIAAARRKLLQVLQREGLLEANARLRVPLVPLRVGLVTSPGSEAHRDFVGQLDRSGFSFDVRLEPSLVQGAEAPRQLAAALARLAGVEPDLVVVVRGGGARADLAAFDSEEVARAIAGAPFPVWTGIGHTGDRSVADEVAQRALITPTACGEAVVGVVASYWEGVLERSAVLSGLARARLDSAHQSIRALAAAVTRGARHQLDRRVDELAGSRTVASRAARSCLEREARGLAGARAALSVGTRRTLAARAQDLDRYGQVLRAYDPRRQLERGWSLTRDGRGRPVRSVAGLAAGGDVTTVFADGEILSRITCVQVGDGSGDVRTGPAESDEGDEVGEWQR